MKINKVQNQYLGTNAHKAKEEKQNNIDIKKEKSVNIEISSKAKDLVKRMEQSEDSKFSERVESIRRSILEGTYKVSSEEIADKILLALDSQKSSDL